MKGESPAVKRLIARGESDALVRRARYTLRTALLLVAVTAACVLTGIAASRWPARLDLTATREHTLSPRTLRVLEGVKQPVHLVLSADPSRLDADAWRRVSDLAAAFARASPLVDVTVIDPSRADAPERVAAVVGALTERDREKITEAAAALGAVAVTIEEQHPRLAGLADAMNERAGAIAPGDAKENALRAVTAVRLASKGLADAAASVRLAIEGPASLDLKLPDVEAAQREGGQALSNALKSMTPALEGPMSVTASMPVRDALALAGDRLGSLRTPDALRVLRTLQERPAVIVYAQSGTTTVDFDALFPRAGGGPGVAAGIGSGVFAGEEFFGTAIASLSSGQRPIVVLVHAERERMIEGAGRPTAFAASALSRTLERLSLRRVDVAEWAVTLDPARPTLSAIDPAGSRPVVWFVMPAPARTSADPKRANSMADRTQRLQRLGDALNTLLTTGHSVLLSLEPCELPAVGEPDPVTEPLKAWGLRPDTARPIVERVSSPRGEGVSSYQSLRAADRATPLGEALDGLATILHWPMAVDVDKVDGVTTGVVMSVPASDAMWGESAWLPLRYLNVRQPFQALMMPEPPKPDAGRDRAAGAFPVVTASQREGAAPGTRPQRLLVVSAPGWFEDLYTQAAGTVDGRRVWAFPGNAELLDSGINWLAGLDELIAASPRIRDVPRVQPMTEARASALRWAMIAGVPLLVLSVGFAVRVLRG